MDKLLAQNHVVCADKGGHVAWVEIPLQGHDGDTLAQGFLGQGYGSSPPYE